MAVRHAELSFAASCPACRLTAPSRRSLQATLLRHARSSSDARTRREGQARRSRDLCERERIELRHDLALEPGRVTLARVLARPGAIAAMPLADRLASCAVYGGAAPRIVALGGLRRERFSCGFDRAKAMFAARLGHAGFAVPTPALENRRAAQRTRDRRARPRFDVWRAPFTRRIGPRLRGLARRCEQRRSRWTWNAAPLISGLRGSWTPLETPPPNPKR
jgi:hypothetical protein